MTPCAAWLILLIGALVSKTVATVFTLVRHPVYTVRSIPRNWMRACFSLDSATSPELVPGYNLLLSEGSSSTPATLLLPIRLDDVRYSVLARELRAPMTWVIMAVTVAISAIVIAAWPFIYDAGTFNWSPTCPMFVRVLVCLAFFFLSLGILASPVRLLLYLPVYSYRMAMKATSILYFPLLWVVFQASFQSSTAEQLEVIRYSPYSGLRRVLSWLTILFIAAKIVLWSALINLSEAWRDWRLAAFLDVYVSPMTIPGWQLASLLNAVVTLLVFYGAARLLDYSRWHPSPIPDDTVRILIRVYIVLTGALSLYSTAANIYIVVRHKPFLHFPGIGDLWPK
jgi:hypothetical protein